MPDIRFLLKVSRPRFWIYIFGPYIVGLIAGVENKTELLSLLYLLFGIYFLYPANLLIYGVNDIYAVYLFEPRRFRGQCQRLA